jgi:hypothetical protein
MADYSFVRSNGKIVGLWLRDARFAQNPNVLMPLISREHLLSGDLMVQIIGRKYRVVPNTFNKAGGCFVMFHGMPAPGEKV